jgi:thiol-disulfide isomerase/thioredoxin
MIREKSPQPGHGRARKITMKIHRLFSALALTLFAGLAATAQNGATPTAASPEKELLQRSMDFMAALPVFSVDMAMKFELANSTGETREGALTGKLDAAGKDKARFRVDTEEGTMELYFSPDAKYLYLAEQNQYLDGKDFGDRRQSLTLMPSREFGPAQIMFSDYLHGEPSLLSSMKTVSRVSEADESPDGAIHIRGESEGISADFWVRQGDQPFLEKLTVDLIQMAKESNPDMTKALVTYTFSAWNSAPAFSEDHFAFKKPEGATELDPSAGSKPEALKGKAAPSIKLDMLDGGTLDLTSHQGKDVVILDFWASWCGPCRKGLPIASEVASQFKDKNVVFYAVNIGEEAEVAQGFLDQINLKIPVALDLNREAAQKYQASSIPMMIVIGKDGVVHEIHRGLSPSLKSDLTKTLTELTK